MLRRAEAEGKAEAEPAGVPFVVDAACTRTSRVEAGHGPAAPVQDSAVGVDAALEIIPEILPPGCFTSRTSAVPRRHEARHAALYDDDVRKPFQPIHDSVFTRTERSIGLNP